MQMQVLLQADPAELADMTIGKTWRYIITNPFGRQDYVG
jgi:hypothetical protein